VRGEEHGCVRLRIVAKRGVGYHGTAHSRIWTYIDKGLFSTVHIQQANLVGVHRAFKVKVHFAARTRIIRRLKWSILINDQDISTRLAVLTNVTRSAGVVVVGVAGSATGALQEKANDRAV
jgi:hypothetical protein